MIDFSDYLDIILLLTRELFVKSDKQIVEGLTRECKKLGVSLSSVILFGSSAKSDIDKSSDIDLIVVVDNNTSDSQIVAVKKYLYSLEEEIGLRIKPSNVFESLQMIFDRMGAQYKSMFVCREDDVNNLKTKNIFATESKFDGVILDNPRLANDIGFKNIILSAKIIYGKDILKQFTSIPPIQRGQMAQNRITYSLLNLYSILVYLFSRNATKYSLSAFKWALHSSYFVRTKKAGNLTEEIAYFSKLYPNTTIFSDTKKIREKYHKSFSYNLRAQYYIWKIFSDSINQVKYPVRLKGRV